MCPGPAEWIWRQIPADKPPFSDLITDGIIEQFRRELEAVRLRPLEPEKKEKES